ncbi:MAG: GUN4 domain-containing protein [Coleofasciculus sp. C1-SOL-03]|jgi:serine/threonine-protein kinase|uniref:GUN4 domain-containing protein n=1 Tax=Coleofasciculus sp. C1-SOL-03 TaxID=3069522 RepID=UPI003303D5A1
MFADNLRSSQAAKYSKLEELLAAGRWREADEETFTMILKITGADKRGYLTNQDIQQFPCQELRAIDQRWVKYSSGQFGFSVQQRIYEQSGKDLIAFADRIGWRVSNRWQSYNELIFNQNAPIGHLPGGGIVGWLAWGDLRDDLFARVSACNL